MKTDNKNNWRLLFTPDIDPYLNMAIDEALTKECINSEDKPATIRFYTWKETSYSIGYFQKTENVLKAIKDKKTPIVRRPTGGSIVYHKNDITFSIVKRRTQTNGHEDITSFYKLIGESLLRGLERLGFTCTFYFPEEESRRPAQEKKPLNNFLSKQSFCSATPAKYDIMIAGSKADSLYMSESAFELATKAKDKELFLIDGATHIETYWKPQYVDQAMSKLEQFYGKNLK